MTSSNTQMFNKWGQQNGGIGIFYCLPPICTPHIYCRVIHNSQDVETTQGFIGRWMDKEGAVYTYNRILFSLKKNEKILPYATTWMNLEGIIYLFIYLFLAVLGLRCCVRLSLVAASRGYSSLQCEGFSLWWLLLLRSTGSRRTGFSSCGTRAQYLWLVGSRVQAQ